jgi:hypothetical protein
MTTPPAEGRGARFGRRARVRRSPIAQVEDTQRCRSPTRPIASYMGPASRGKKSQVMTSPASPSAQRGFSLRLRAIFVWALPP